MHMNAVEIRGLKKSFHGLYALDGLDMTVPVGAVYGLIGATGAGKTTAEKLICGHLIPDRGTIALFGRSHRDAGVRARVGAMIGNDGCFPGSTVYQNLMMQTISLNLKRPDEEIRRVLKVVRMEDSAGLRYRRLSPDMRPRVGIAMALVGRPALLILDEPFSAWNAEERRLMREILTDVSHDCGCTVLISARDPDELEHIATHYGIIRGGKMLREMTATQLEGRCRGFTEVRAPDMHRIFGALRRKYRSVRAEDGAVLVYDAGSAAEVAEYLRENGQSVSEIKAHGIGFDEYCAALAGRKAGETGWSM